MFHGEKIVESVRSASAPEEGELLIRLPVEHAHRAKTIWLEKLFGKLLDPDLAGTIRREVQGVRSVQTTACEPAGSGGPSPPWWSLLQGCRASESESEGVRRDHAMRRDHLWAPRPQPGGVLPSSDTPCIRSPAAAACGGGGRRRAGILTYQT